MADLPELSGMRVPEERRAALKALGDEPPAPPERAEELLFTALGDDDYAVRHSAVDLAVRWRPRLGAAVLERALRDETSLGRRSAAMEAFGRVGAPAVPLLERLGAEDNPGVRRLAVDALGLTRAREAYPALAQLADDDSPAVRAAALEGLSRLPHEDAPRRIEEAVARRDEHATVVLAGLLALDALGRVLPGAVLKPHLADALTAAPALRLLGRAGEPEPLVDVLAKVKGARARAAVVGLALSFSARPGRTRAAMSAARERLSEPLLAVVEGRDIPATAAALQLSGELGLVEGLAAVAHRPDRMLFLSAAHRTVGALAASGGIKERLEALRDDNDAEAAQFITELLAGLAEGLGRPTSRSPTSSSASSSRPPITLSPAAPPRMSPEQFAALADLFLRVAGLLFESHAAYRLEARLLPRLRARGLSSWDAYLQLLERSGDDPQDELAVALDRVTVHETYFFRERYQLDEFSGRVLPAFAGQDRRDLDELLHVSSSPVRVLSAGCSTGEEAWTLAILLEESGLFLREGYEVVGIDISPSSVEAAEKGLYGRRGFRGDAPDGVLARWFEEEGAQRAVDPKLREHVHFHVGNLVEPNHMAALGRFHAIFCRNVMIYMSDDARARVIAHFRERLLPGGILFVGHSESLLNMDTGLRFLPLDRELAYVRPREGDA